MVEGNERSVQGRRAAKKVARSPGASAEHRGQIRCLDRREALAGKTWQGVERHEYVEWKKSRSEGRGSCRAAIGRRTRYSRLGRSLALPGFDKLQSRSKIRSGVWQFP